jgi:hypothetical protein
MCKPICFAIENLANFSNTIRTFVPALVAFDTLGSEHKRHISLSSLALRNELIGAYCLIGGSILMSAL